MSNFEGFLGYTFVFAWVIRVMNTLKKNTRDAWYDTKMPVFTLTLSDMCFFGTKVHFFISNMFVP